MIPISIIYLNFLLIVSGLEKSPSEDCTFNENIVVGKMYKLSSVDYPKSQNTTDSCKWIIKSPRGVTIKCHKIMVANVRLFIHPQNEIT